MAKKDISEPVALSCDTIGDQDSGMARFLVDAEIQKALNDLADRAEEDGKSRRVMIEIEIGLHNGMVFSNVAAQAKLPPRRSKSTAGKLRMKSKGNHEMLFQPHNGDRHDQPTFEVDEGGEIKE